MPLNKLQNSIFSLHVYFIVSFFFRKIVYMNLHIYLTGISMQLPFTKMQVP